MHRPKFYFLTDICSRKKNTKCFFVGTVLKVPEVLALKTFSIFPSPGVLFIYLHCFGGKFWRQCLQKCMPFAGTIFFLPDYSC